MRKNNRVIIAAQGLCLILILVIQCTLTHVLIPTIEATVYEQTHHLISKAEAYTVLSLMLGMLIMVLESCKEHKD